MVVAAGEEAIVLTAVAVVGGVEASGLGACVTNVVLSRGRANNSWSQSFRIY